MSFIPHTSSTPTPLPSPSGAHVVRGTGIALLVLGFVAIVLPQAATLATELLVGSLLLLSGIAGLVLTASTRAVFGWRSLGLVSALTLLAGAFLLAMPSVGERVLTATLAALFPGAVCVMVAPCPAKWRPELRGDLWPNPRIPLPAHCVTRWVPGKRSREWSETAVCHASPPVSRWRIPRSPQRIASA